MNQLMHLPGYLLFGLSLAHAAPTPNRVFTFDAAKPAANAKELPEV